MAKITQQHLQKFLKDSHCDDIETTIDDANLDDAKANKAELESFYKNNTKSFLNKLKENTSAGMEKGGKVAECIIESIGPAMLVQQFLSTSGSYLEKVDSRIFKGKPAPTYLETAYFYTCLSLVVAAEYYGGKTVGKAIGQTIGGTLSLVSSTVHGLFSKCCSKELNHNQIKKLLALQERANNRIAILENKLPLYSPAMV